MIENYKDIVEQQLKLRGELYFKVKGISMIPTIKDGERVKVFTADNYHEGEIVLFIYHKRLIVHRIIKIYKGIYFCKGDNTISFERIKVEDIIGKVKENGVQGKE